MRMRDAICHLFIQMLYYFIIVLFCDIILILKVETWVRPMDNFIMQRNASRVRI